MSIVERSRPVRRDARSAGYTFLEMIAVLSILSLMALVIERTVSSASSAERQLDATRRATERSERLSYEILDDTGRSRKLYNNDPSGLAYLAALDLTRDPPLASARLPVFDEGNPLGMDQAGDPRTGNILMFARESDPAPTVSDKLSRKVRFIDMYRMVCVYPHQTTRNLITDNPQLAVDLVAWRSVRFPSYAQIIAVTNPAERVEVVQDLVQRFGFDYAWDPTKDVDSAFFAMSPSGAISALPTTGLVIDEDVDLSDRGRLVYANCQLAPTNPQDYRRRNVFTVDAPATWTPGGFEVKIVGSSGARKVWVHIVVETQSARGVLGVHASTVIASAKDL